MTDSELEFGPVDYLIVEWPAGKEPTGEGLAILGDLTDRGLIQVLDLVFVRKNEDGTVAGLALMDIDARRRARSHRVRGRVVGSARPGRLQRGGRGARAGRLRRDPALREHLGAAVRAAVRRSGAQLVASGRIPHDDLVDALETLESTSA